MPLQTAALWPALVQTRRLAGAAELQAKAAPGLGMLESACTGARRDAKKQQCHFLISAAPLKSTARVFSFSSLLFSQVAATASHCSSGH